MFWRGYGLPVRSMFLKLSTSREALLMLLLLLPGVAPSADVRSSPPALCGSMLARVFANGLAGTTDGDKAGKLLPAAVFELAMASAAAAIS